MPPIRHISGRFIQAAAADCPSDLRLSLEAGEESGFVLLEAEDGEDSKKLRKFSMTAYTGGRLHLKGFAYPVVVDLSGMRIPKKSRPILRGHDPDRIAGHSTAVTNSGGSLKLDGVISGANDCAREIAESADNGFPWESSIGAQATKMVFVDRGEKVSVNGRAFVGPLYVARQSVLKEISFVPMGADEGGASATVTAHHNTSPDSPMPPFAEWLNAQGFQEDTLSDQSRTFLQGQYNRLKLEAEEGDAEPKTRKKTRAKQRGSQTIHAGGDGDSLMDDLDLSDIRAQYAAETKRVKGIRTICAKYGDVMIPIQGEDGETTNVDLESHAVEAGWTTDQTELHALRHSRPKAPAGHIAPGRDDLNAKAIEASLLLSTSHSEEQVAKQYDEKTMEAALSKKYRHWTLHALMGAVIHAAGQHFVGNHKTDDFIRATKTAERAIKAAGFSTLSVANVLENVANKSLIASYESVETVWQEFCAIKSYSDFKVQSRYRLDSSGAFKKVGADGELKHVGMTDAKYTNQLDTFGAIIALNRQMMINDDLDAFLDIPRFLGEMAANRQEEEFFVLLLSNPGSFYSVGNKNLITGAGSALSIDALTDAENKFRDQVKPNGKPLLITPQKLLVGTALKVTADVLHTEQTIVDGTATAKQPAKNPHAGKYKPICSPYLNNTAITDQDGNALSGQSSTQWYLFANPNQRAAFVMGTLNGQRRPVIESEETPFETLGMQWRGYLDFGVGAEDPVASVRSAGG